MMEHLEGRQMLSAWYVAASGGLSTNPGTLAKPFAAIQQAANLAQPGDTVYIETGTYRETVTPVHSGTAAAPITYEPYNNESVLIDGANLLSGWTQYSGNIYWASQSYDLGDGNNQAFQGGQMLTEARWPNSSLDPLHFTTAAAATMTATVATTGLSTATLTNASLTQPAGYWVGATIHLTPGIGWIWETGTITASSPGSITFSYQQLTKYEVPSAGNEFYITGKLGQLDSPGEFYHDTTTNRLYVWQNTGTGTPTNIETKARQYAFDLSNLSYINITGIQIKAATINTSASSSHLNLSGLNVTFVSQKMDDAFPWNDKYSPHTTGIILNGTYNTISNSIIAYSSGDGVFLGGSYNTVNNCTISNTDYAGFDYASVAIDGSYDTVSHSNLAYTGRSGITFYFSPHTQILNNVIHDICLLGSDAGAVYAWTTDGQGSRISDNIIYNCYAGGYGADGILIDNNCSNIVVDHNLVYNADNDIKMNAASVDDSVYNNTFITGAPNPNTNPYPKNVFGKPSAFNCGATPSMSGTTLANNIFVGPTTFPTGVIQNHNLFSSTGVNFVDPTHNNYQLGAGSVAINAGAVFAPYTNGYLGSAPDIGAYEYGSAPFQAGTLTTAVNAFAPINAASYSAEQGVTIQSPGLGSLDNGDWVKYSSVNFGSGANTFTANLAVPAQYAGQKIQIRSDSLGGVLLGTLTVSSTGAWSTFVSESTAIASISGIHDIYLVFQGTHGVCNLNYFEFSQSVGATK